MMMVVSLQPLGGVDPSTILAIIYWWGLFTPWTKVPPASDITFVVHKRLLYKLLIIIIISSPPCHVPLRTAGQEHPSFDR